MWSQVYLADSITLLSNHPFVIGTRLRPEKLMRRYVFISIQPTIREEIGL